MSRRIRVSTLVLGLILAGPAVAEGQSAVAAELPTYEVMGFPITPHQVSLMGLPNVQERSPTPMLMSGGVPASPHQVTVLTPRPRMTEEGAAAHLVTAKALGLEVSAKMLALADEVIE
jgi:hypothetical protein